MEDESTITEISIAPDGRVYVFGASVDVLEILAEISEPDAALHRRLDRLRSAGSEIAADVGSDGTSCCASPSAVAATTPAWQDASGEPL